MTSASWMKMLHLQVLLHENSNCFHDQYALTLQLISKPNDKQGNKIMVLTRAFYLYFADTVV